jgi:predicted transcriptional regulator
VLYRLGEASGGDLLRELPEIPSYSALRSVLRALEAKGVVAHRAEDLRYVYRPVVPRARASRAALRRVVDTYFGGAFAPALKALLDVSRDSADEIDFAELRKLIDDARAEGR